MITKITINNFKKLENISFSLAQSVVIIGPNNAGKSTIFQALCLWELGVTKYLETYQKNDLNERGTATINRRDLVNTPIADGRFLWNNRTTEIKDNGNTTPIKLEIELEGEIEGEFWKSKTEFEFSNAESFSCKLIGDVKQIQKFYNTGKGIHFGFLQPMSGISTNEDKLTTGSIDRKLGEGKTAEVLRNICYEILFPDIPHPKGYNPEENWKKLCKSIKAMFGADLQKPEFIKVTGIIQLEYLENSIKYDISSAGRGFQQTLLLLAYMYANPDTVLLLDEPDAHLEVIRQREVFQLINKIATDLNSQIILASHSEVVLDEAAESSKVIAIIENKIHELNTDTNTQKISYIKKALTEIGWEKYYLARVKKHILYLEGSTDLEMLKMFAQKLKHKSEPLLKLANVQYTADNVPNTAVNNYVSLSAIFPELKGLALFDNLPNLKPNPKLQIICWHKRELENYFAKPDVLLKHAKQLASKFPNLGTDAVVEMMQQSITNLTPPMYINDLKHEWWDKTKLSDEWLEVIFSEFYKKLGIPIDFYKRDYYKLIHLMEVHDIPNEISDKLDIIYELIK